MIRRRASYNQTAAVSTICYVVVPPKALSEVDENRLDELAKTIEVKSSDFEPNKHEEVGAAPVYKSAFALRRKSVNGSPAGQASA